MTTAVDAIIDIFAKTLTGGKYKCVLNHFTDWGPAAQLALALGQDGAREKLKSIQAGDATAELIVIESVVCKLSSAEVNKLRGQIYALFGNKTKAQQYGIKYALPKKLPKSDTPSNGGKPPKKDLTPTKDEQNTMLYVAIGALILLVVLKR